jgi:hypothetical protein
VRVTALHGTRRVVLPPALRVSLELDVPEKLRDARYHFSAGIDAQPDADGIPPPTMLTSLRRVRFDGAGRASVEFPCAGRFVFWIDLTTQDPADARSTFETTLSISDTIELRDTDGDQHVALKLDPDTLARCYDRLGIAH